MASTPIRADDLGYLNACRHQVLRSVDGLDEYQLRQPMTSTGTKGACDHSDDVLGEVGLEASARVPWWPEGLRTTTARALLSRVLKDTAMHAGQLQILRELIDGRAGNDRSETGDDRWWAAYVQDLERLARQFRS